MGYFNSRRVLWALCVLLPVAGSLRPLPSADLWWQLASGRMILETHSIPAFDPFSYTAQAKSWMNHEWLSCVIFYLLYIAGGIPALQIFKIAALTTAFLLGLRVSLSLGRSLPASTIALALCVFCSASGLFYDVRPYLFTYVFLVIFVHQMEAYSKKGSLNVLAVLPPVCALWANLHAGYIIFLGIVGIYAQEAILLEGKKSLEKNGRAFAVLATGAACLAFSLLNPHGYRILLYPFTFACTSFYKQHLVEWVAPRLSGTTTPFWILACLLAAGMIVLRRRFRPVDFLFFGAFMGLSVGSIRHIPLFCLVCVPSAALILDEFIARFCAIGRRFFMRWPGRETLAESVVSAFLIALAFLLLAARLDKRSLSDLSMETALFPVGAVEFIRANNIPRELYNPYEWGGYVIWKLYPKYRVFIDGRANTVYPEKIYRESLDSMMGLPSWKKIMSNYGVNVILASKFQLGRGFLLADEVLRDPGWLLVYEDELARVFLRKASANSALVQSYLEGKLRYPEYASFYLFQGLQAARAGRWDEAAMMFEWALKIEPKDVRAMVNLGVACLHKGDEAKGIRLLEEAIRLDPFVPVAHFNLGSLYEKKGEYGRAREEYRRELRINPGYTPAVESLKGLGGK